MSDWQPLGRQSLLAARSTRAAGQTEEPCAPPTVPRSAPRVGQLPALFMEPLRGSNPPWRFSCDGAPSQSALVSPFNLTEPRRWLFSSTSCAKPLFSYPEHSRAVSRKETANGTSPKCHRNVTRVTLNCCTKAVKWGDGLKPVRSRLDMTGSRIPYPLFNPSEFKRENPLETSGNRWRGVRKK